MVHRANLWIDFAGFRSELFRSGMKLAVSLLTLMSASSRLSAQSAKISYADLLRPPGHTYHHVPIGLCEDYPEESTTPAIIRGDMELLKRSGIKLLRIAFGWDGIEGKKGAYDWLFWDDYVKMAVDEYGITLIPYICYTPRWNSTGDSTNYWNHTPKDYEAFGAFVLTIVGRYKDRIHSWELWNEPDISAFWSGTAEELARLTKIGSQAVKKADPDAIVVLAGLAGNTRFTEALFKDYGISPYVDVVNIHNYYETWNSTPIEAIVDEVNTVHDIVKRFGRNQSIWMAEVGYSSFRKPDGYVSDWSWSTYAYEHTAEYQAVHLIKALTLDLSTERLAAVAWYRIKDLKPGEAVIGDVNNRFLGVARLDHTPKPAEKAITFFNRMFSQSYRCIDRQTVVRRTLGSDSEVHTFEIEDGSVVIVGWLKTRIPGRAGNEPIGTLEDRRRETVTLTLPKKLAGGGVLYDELGSGHAFTEIDNGGPATVVSGLILDGGAISILKLVPK